MSFTSLNEVVNALGASEKKVEDNYVTYLDNRFNDWRKWNCTQQDNEVIYSNAQISFKIVYKNDRLKKPIKIEFYENAILENTLLLNRRNNGTIRHLESNDGQKKDQYLDAYFENYLTVIYDEDNEIESYELNLFELEQSFPTIDALIDGLMPQNIKGLDFFERVIIADEVLLNGDTIELLLNKDVISGLTDIKIGKESVLDNLELEDDKIKISLSENLTLSNGTKFLRLEYRGVWFRVVTDELRTWTNEMLRKNNDDVWYWGLAHNKMYRILVRTNEYDKSHPITSMDALQVEKFKKDDTFIDLKFDGTEFENLEFFVMSEEKKEILEFSDLDENWHRVFVENINSELYVTYTRNNQYEVRKVEVNEILRETVDTLGNISVSTMNNVLTFSFENNDEVVNPKLNILIKHRGSGDVRTIEPIKNITKLQYSIQIDDLPWGESPNLTGYDTSIFDLSICFADIIDSQIVAPIRILWNEYLPEEVSGQFNSAYNFVMYVYGTSNKNEISFRFYFIKPDALALYEKQKKEDIFVSKQGRKPVVVVAESPTKAQDNGLQMFNYLVSLYSQEIDTYYVLTEDSDDRANFTEHADKIIDYKSVRHFEIMQRADFILHTNSSFYAYPLNTSFWQQRRLRTHKMFLQHGIIGVRDLSRLYGADPLFTNKFVVSSEREKDIVVGKMGYKSKDVVNTGLARFDKLLASSSFEKNTQLSRKIVIMPSWRKFQDKLHDSDFIETEFYKGWQAFINNPHLVELAEAENLEIVFYLHHNFQKYVHLFDSPVVRMIHEDEVTIQELLMNNGLLITDFSSVALDFALQERKVFYYEVDDAITDEIPELAAFFPGDIYFNADTLITDIMAAIKDPSLSDSEKQKLDNLYTYRDTHARERTYEVMAKMLKASAPKPLYKRVKRRLKRLINGR